MTKIFMTDFACKGIGMPICKGGAMSVRTADAGARLPKNRYSWPPDNLGDEMIS